MPSERWVEKAREWWDKHAKEEPDTTCCDSEAQERATIAWAEDVNRDGVAALAALLEEVEASAVEDFLSEEPCPKCRCGPSWECYGCKWKDAQRERDEALERETLNRQAAEKWYESSESYRTLRDEARAEERERAKRIVGECEVAACNECEGDCARETCGEILRRLEDER